MKKNSKMDSIWSEKHYEELFTNHLVDSLPTGLQHLDSHPACLFLTHLFAKLLTQVYRNMEKAIEKLPLFSTFYNRKGCYLIQGSISPCLCMRPSLYYVSKKTGWVQKNKNGCFYRRSVLYLC